MFKKIALAVASLAIGTGAAVSAASADPGNLFDVTLGVDNVTLTSGSCIDIPIRFNHDAKVHAIEADIQVWKGDQYLADPGFYEFEDEYDYDGSPFTPLAGTLIAEFYYCPGDLGRFVVGPTAVGYTDRNFDEGSFNDVSTSSFEIRQGARFKTFTASKKKAVRTFSLKPQYFKVIDYADKWTKLKKGTKVILQTASSKTGAWSKVKTGKVAKNGSVTIKVSASKKEYYRIVYRGNASIAGATSKIIRK